MTADPDIAPAGNPSTAGAPLVAGADGGLAGEITSEAVPDEDPPAPDDDAGDDDAGDDASAWLAIEVAEPCPAWRERLAAPDRLCRRAARAAVRAALRSGGMHGPAVHGATELSLMLADDAVVHDLNRRWRGRDKPTNVLAFPSGEAPPLPASGAPWLLGDVVLAFETVAGEAAAQGKSLADHASHLVVHGVLHLLGWDHETAAEAERMEALETAVLAGLGIADPYVADPDVEAKGTGAGDV